MSLVIVAIFVWEGVISYLPLPAEPRQGAGHHERALGAGARRRLRRQLRPLRAIAPFVEELTFRGSGQSLLRFLGRWPSIVLVGVAFGLAHGLLEALLVLVPFGIALAWLRDRTNSVVPGMLVHAFFNAAALILIVVG